MNDIRDGKEFLVQDILKRTSDVLIIGCSNNRAVFRVGDIFNFRYEVTQSYEDMMSGAPEPPPENILKINLAIIGINSMRTQIQELPAGVTGALSLSGDDIIHLYPKCLIRT